MATLASAGRDEIRLWKVPGDDQPFVSISRQARGIRSLVWNPKTLEIACGAGDGTICLIHPSGRILETLRCRSVSGISNEEVNSLAFSNNGTLLCSGGTDRILKVWNLKKFEVIQNLKGHLRPITCMGFNSLDDHMISGSASGDMVIHNLLNGSTVATMRHGESGQSLNCMQFSGFRKNVVAVGGDDCRMSVWDVVTREQICSFDSHKAPVTGVAFSTTHAALICSTGLDKKLNFFDITSKKTVKTIPTDQPLHAVSFLHRDNTVAVGNSEGVIQIFDLRKFATASVPEPTTTYTAHAGSPVTALAFQPTSDKLNIPKAAARPTSTTPSQPTQQQQQPHIQSSREISSRERDFPGPEDLKQSKHSQVRQDIFSPLKDYSALQTPADSERYKPRTASAPLFSPPVSVVSSRQTGKLDVEDMDALFSPVPSSVPSTLTAVRATTTFSQPKNISPPSSVVSVSAPSRPNVISPPEPTTNILQSALKPPLRPSHPPSSSSLPSSQPPPGSSTSQLFTPAKPNKIPAAQPSVPDSGARMSSSRPVSQSSVSLSHNGETRERVEESVTNLLTNVQRVTSSISNRSSISSSHNPSPRKNFSDSHSQKTEQSVSSVPVSIAGSAQGSEGTNGVETFQMRLVQSMMESSLSGTRESIIHHLQNMHLDMLRQFQLQQDEMRTMLDEYAKKNELLMAENAELREENYKLRFRY